MTLTLSLHGLVMVLFIISEVYICIKLSELPSKDKRDMKGIQNLKLKHVTFKCDLDL